MRVRVRLDGRSPRRWHTSLIALLVRLPGVELDLDASPGPGGVPENAALLFRLEALLGRVPLDGPSARLPAESLVIYPVIAAAPDLVIDLCGDVAETPGVAVWALAFDGIAGEEGLLASLLDSRMPVATLSEGGRIIASGRLGTESIGAALISFEDAVTRTTTLIVAAVAGYGPLLAPGVAETVSPPPEPDLGPRRLGIRAGRMLAWAIVRRLYHLCYRAPHWRVGWRRLDGPDLFDLRAHPGTGWKDLPDDGHRFYADPFGIDHDGRTFLFVEDYEHARGKAVISAVAFDAHGPVGGPVPVLDEPYHLSYPFVFARDGALWMIPEGSANGTVDLYRSTAFPGGWVKESTLLSGLTAGDVTLVERDGRWWMFATVRDIRSDNAPGPVRGSYSDALHLWSAPDFRGPWTPHARNPVLIDIASARPAGHVVERGGVLVRPVQDGRRGYGEALAFARIDRLDDEGFSQTVETTLRAGPLWPGKRLHTVNRSAGFEFIDGSGRAPRLPFRLHV